MPNSFDWDKYYRDTEAKLGGQPAPEAGQDDARAGDTRAGATRDGSHLLDHDVVILQQVRSFLKDDFEIHGPDGEVIGYILTEGSALSRMFLGSRQLSVVDAQHTSGQAAPGELALRITDPANWVRDTYEVYLADSDQRLAEITQKIAFLKRKLAIGIDGHPGIEFRGDVFGYNAEVVAGDRQLAVIQRQWAGMANLFFEKQKYCLRFAPGLPRELHAAILGAAIAADLIAAKADRRN
ncbi:LURP-one-related/scramblase family protein [Corynebacterium uterequi]|uniref:Scramblase n=1 Tax=Corynebacterium uterequi TaxID=1072256 RepID=A0A0G3HGT8_9CORY|nr:hypothetical protein [Corynebacterium uterequi]AKK10357.1 hypothetical protein CUTER_01705 [Corynebacterium uterequi]